MTLNWTDYANPVFATEDQNHINCDLTVTDIGVIPFTASINDVIPYGRDIYAAIIANQDTIPIGAYVAPPPKAPRVKKSNPGTGPTVI